MTKVIINGQHVKDVSTLTWISGPRDMEGTFSAELTSETLEAFQKDERGVVRWWALLYGPKDGNIIQRTWWKLRQRFGHAWPEEVIAEGDAYVDFSAKAIDGLEERIDVTFRSTGKWDIKP